MKKILLTSIATLTTIFLFGQRELDSLSYDNTQDIEFFKKIKNRTLVKKYLTQNGNLLKIGDTVILGAPTSQEINSRTYSGSYGNRARAGVSSTRSTTNRTFSYVKKGRPAGFGSIMSAMNGDAPTMAGDDLRNTKVIIKEMKAYHRGSKKKPLYLILILGEINGRAFDVHKYLSVMDTELALESGEVLLLNRKMTRAEAILQLKEAKELYDIEMLTQQEFDSLKKKLAPIIKSKL